MKFKVGESGNPSGRPKHTGYRQQLFNSLVEPYRDSLFAKALELALDGNESMLRLFLERMLPAKPVDDVVTLPMPEIDAKKLQNLIVAGEAILQAVYFAEITPDQGCSLMAVLDAQRKQIESSELALRVSEIERTLNERKKSKQKQK